MMIEENFGYFDIKLDVREGTIRVAKRSKVNSSIMLDCVNEKDTGFSAALFDYKKSGCVWTTENRTGRLEVFHVKREYTPETPEFKAFEELSRIRIGSINLK